MLTARGFWFLVTVLALLGLSVALSSASAVLICLTLLLWFLAQWFLFHARLRAIDRHLKLERTLSTSRGVVESIWARLLGLPEDTVVHTGHGDDTTVGAERAHIAG